MRVRCNWYLSGLGRAFLGCGIVSVFLGSALPAARAIVLLNDGFDDGERLTQNLPESAHWFNRRPAGELTVQSIGGDNMLKTATSTTGFWAHFAPSGSPVALAVGDWIELSAEVRGDGPFTDARDLGLAWGLWDSKGTRDIADNSGTGGARTDDTGYLVWTNPGKDHTAASRVSRGTTGNDHYVAHTQLQTFDSFNWGAVPQTVSLRITRTGASEMTLEAAIGATALSGAVIDSAATDFTFDTVSFFFDNRVFSPGTGSLIVDDVVVRLIPEPAVAGLVGLSGLLLLRRR
jgi:hypothetical protein